MNGLPAMIEAEMGDLITAYGLSLVRVSDGEALLRSTNFILWFTEGREGVDVIYVETTATGAWGYNVLNFLDRRRSQIPWAPALPTRTHQEFVRGQVAGIARMLRSAAADILAGERGWLDEYRDRWPAMPFNVTNGVPRPDFREPDRR